MTEAVTKKPNCDHEQCRCMPSYVCYCPRCFREVFEERFRACLKHFQEVSEKHERVRQRPVVWVLVNATYS